MPRIHELDTTRLLLRAWRDEDLEPFAAMNADPEVMRHLLGTMSREESDASAARGRAHIDQHGFGFWAVEEKGGSPFIGFVGLIRTSFEAHFTPCVEVGWRLARDAWGRGYATEAAQESLRFGFEELKLDEIVSFTVPGNIRSRRVMERLGMTHSSDGDFEHPRVPVGHPLRRHVLYRVSRGSTP
jgi:RimJ/RimL family protein N-acetyltransferase